MEHQETTDAHWIAADQNGTRLRVWQMSGTTAGATGEATLPSAQITVQDLTKALLPLINDDRGPSLAQVVICGFDGAQAPVKYPSVPCPLHAVPPVLIDTGHPTLRLYAVAGLRQTAPPDLLCGDETRIAGFLKYNPTFDGVICLPGTTSRWVRVSANEIVSFRSFLTGETITALSQHSVLRHSMSAPGWDDSAFKAALNEALSQPRTIAGRLFSLRAEALLNDQTPAVSRARLSGFLIGAELAAARPYWLDQSVAVIADSTTAPPYLTALTGLGAYPLQADPDAMTRAGLGAARAALSTPTP